MANNTEKSIKVIITTPTIQTNVKAPIIQQNLNVSVPVYPSTDNVINASDVNDLSVYTNQTEVNEYLNEKIGNLDLQNLEK